MGRKDKEMLIMYFIYLSTTVHQVKYINASLGAKISQNSTLDWMRIEQNTCMAVRLCVSASVWWGLLNEGRFSHSTWREQWTERKGESVDE